MISKKMTIKKSKETPISKSKNKKNFSSIGFILSTIGAALGLGNIWKFPYLVANYGGAFFIAFFLGLLFIGVPMIIMEINIGKMFKSSSMKAYKTLNKKAEFYGWVQTLIAGVIGIYYAVVIGWTLIGLVQSFIPHYFQNHGWTSIINLPHDNGVLSHLNSTWIIGLVVTWVAVIGIVILGVKNGIEKTNLFLLPSLLVMLIIVAIYSTTLSGSKYGLEYLFRLKSSEFGDLSMWRAAFGQVFFSSCLAAGAIITYSKYSQRNQDVNNVALTIVLSNTFVSIISSILVFSIIGYDYNNALAGATPGNPVGTFETWFSNNHLLAGPPLIFVTCPQIFGHLMGQIGYLGNIIAILFFLTITFAAITSIISMGLTVFDNLKDKFPNLKEKTTVVVYSLIAFAVGIIMTSNIGPSIIDSTDFWVSSNVMVLSGIVECILITYVFRKLTKLQEFGNARSIFKVGIINRICVGIVSPIILTITLVYTLINGTFAIETHNFTGTQVALLIAIPLVTLLLSIFGGLMVSKYCKLNRNVKLFKSLLFIIIPILTLLILLIIGAGIRIVYDGNSNIAQLIAFCIAIGGTILVPAILSSIPDSIIKEKQKG